MDDNFKSNAPEVVSSSLTNGIALQLILQFCTISKATLIDNEESRRLLSSFLSSLELLQRFVTQLQRENVAIHSLWKMQHAYLMNYEELVQCRSRISVRSPSGWSQAGLQTTVREIEECDIPVLLYEETESCKKYFATLSYDSFLYFLFNARSTQISQLLFIRSSTSLLVEKSNLTCMICMSEVAFPCSVLPCGHMYCTECLEAMIDSSRRNSTSLKCPLCHRIFSVNEVLVFRLFSEIGDDWRCVSTWISD